MPLFPISIWNCYDRVLSDQARTNNSLESWHKQFEMDVGKHPTTNKLIEQFRIEQKNSEILFQQLLGGDQYKKNKSQVEKDFLIKSIVKDYRKSKVDDFFKKIILHL